MMVGFLFLVIVAAASVSTTSVTAFSVTSSSSFITLHGHLPPRHNNINNNCRRHCNLALELYHTHEDCETNKSSSNDDDVSSISSNEQCRRSMIATTFTTLLTISSSTSCSASTDDEEKVYVKGVATLQSGITINNNNDTNNPPNNENAALYVTARPNKADNVPRAILDGSNGRPPPVLSARYPNPTFPFEFRLTSQNYTPEGASSIIEEGNR